MTSEKTNKQRAREILRNHNWTPSTQMALAVEDERVLLAITLAASTLEGKDRDEFNQMLEGVIEKVKNLPNSQSLTNIAVSNEEEAKRLYKDAIDITQGKWHDDPGLGIKLPVNLTLALGQAVGCGTSVYKGVIDSNYSFATAFFIGLTSFGANLFFTSQSLPGILSKVGVDMQDSWRYDEKWLKTALLFVGREVVRQLSVVPTAGIDTSFAINARYVPGLIIGDAQSVLTFLAMGIIYRDELVHLAKKISHPIELGRQIVESLREDSLALNAFRVISASAAIARVIAFADKAAKTYERELGFSRTVAVVAASLSVPPEGALATFAALGAADFFYEKGVELAPAVRDASYAAYNRSVEAIKAIPTLLRGAIGTRTANNNGPFVSLEEGEAGIVRQDASDSAMAGLYTAFAGISSSLARHLPKILLAAMMTVLVLNAAGNVYLSDSDNPLVWASIFWVSLSVCARSVLTSETLGRSASEHVELLRNPSSLADQEGRQLTDVAAVFQRLLRSGSVQESETPSGSGSSDTPSSSRSSSPTAPTNSVRRAAINRGDRVAEQ